MIQNFTDMKIILSSKLLFIFALVVVLTLSLIYTSVRNGTGYYANFIKPEVMKIDFKHLEKKEESREKTSDVQHDETEQSEKSKLKYILQWTSPKNVPFVYMGKGQQGFIERKCPFTNCFVTADRNYLDGDYTKFDVIAFAGPEVVSKQKYYLPKKRSPHQKFVFASIESPGNYPICSSMLNGFFNWTWTYKLDSESKWGYLVIRDSNGTIIGPKTDMHWIKQEDMKPVSEDLKKILKGKNKTAAWFVSNCDTINFREHIFRGLRSVLENKYGRTIDVYGACGTLKCSRKTEHECDQMIERDYYFYLAFENSNSEDYVTEKITHALKFSAIPIVFGGANYSRFLPEWSYLSANYDNVLDLAKKMVELIDDFDKYVEYFKWRNHYTYHRRAESVETDDYCGFCTILNDEKKVKQITVYEDFKKWWNSPDLC